MIWSSGLAAIAVLSAVLGWSVSGNGGEVGSTGEAALVTSVTQTEEIVPFKPSPPVVAVAPDWVGQPWTPLSASLVGLPEQHKGEEFSFFISLSAQTEVTVEHLTGQLLRVDGGQIVAVESMGGADLWGVRVAPDPQSDLTIHLGSTPSCAEIVPICSVNRVELTAPVEAVVAAPPPPPAPVQQTAPAWRPAQRESYGNVVHRGARALPAGSAGVMYFTFDDGPDPTWTPQILDVLARHNARATFFVQGWAVEPYEGLLSRILAEGHTLANHTWGHEMLDTLTEAEFNRTVLSTQYALGDRGTMCLRPPYYRADGETFARAGRLGFDVIMGNVRPEDWSLPGADVIAQRIIMGAEHNAIVVLHDGGHDRTQTVAGLEMALSHLGSEGYVFEPVCQ